MTKHKSKMKTLKQSIHFSLVCFSCFLLTENWLTSLVGWLDTWVAHKLANISPRLFEIIQDDHRDKFHFPHMKMQRISLATNDNRIFLMFFIQKVINGIIFFAQAMPYRGIGSILGLGAKPWHSIVSACYPRVIG